MPQITLALLGSFEVRPAGAPALHLPKKTQALLAYLALRPGQTYARDRLAGLLWGETGDEQARKSLRQALYVLQKALPATQPPTLRIAGETIALEPATVEVDAVAFEHLLATGSPDALEQAAGLYRGDLLEGLNVNEAPFDEWLTAERERLRELALQAWTRLLAQQAAAGHTERAIRTAVRLLALDPLQESVHRRLMRLYARQGRCSAALKQYQVCVATLQRELGTEPEPETKQLYQDLLQRRTRAPARARANAQHALRSPHPAPRVALEPALEPFKRDAPLIGREAELARLRRALDEALAGRGQVVAIMGEVGIGKSSILAAIAAEAHARGARSLLGRSYQTEQVLTFGPWVEALRSGQVVAETDVLDALPPPWRAELVRLLPEIDQPGGTAARSMPDPRSLFEALTELVRKIAAKQPVLVMLEDVHWADEMSARLIAFLARRTRAARVLVVVTLRDEELASTPLLRDVVEELTREPHFLQLTLPPLTRSDTLALVRSLSHTAWPAPNCLDEHIWRISEGNPFMVVETVRALQEGVRPSAPTAMPLPERVHRVVAGRLERLSQQGRHLVAVAAIIGREFDFALLQRAAGLDERQAAEGVEELVRRRVLHGLGERFDFTHERLREVAYDQLLQPRRKVLHVEVARALEDLYTGSLELDHAALASHYRAGEVWDKAVLHAQKAGVRALRLSAYSEAVAWFEHALAALRRVPESRQTLEAAIDLRFDLRNALLPLAELDRIRGYLQDAERLTKALDDQRRIGWLSVYMSHYCRTAGHFVEASGFADTARHLGDLLGDVSLGLDAGLDLGAAYLSLGEYRRAAELLRGIVRSLDEEPGGRPPSATASPAVLARTYLVRALTELGEFDEGLVCGEDGLRLAQALEDPLSLTYACMRLGRLHAARGDIDRAASLLEQGCQLARTWSITFAQPVLEADLGHVYALQGRVADGLPLLRGALEGYESRRREVGRARLLIHLGVACQAAGQLGDARAHAEAALAHARARGQRGYETYALLLLGDIAADRAVADLDTAAGHYDESITLASALGMRPLLARGLLGLGSVHHQRGGARVAREHFSGAVALFGEMGMATWLPRAEAGLAKARRCDSGPA